MLGITFISGFNETIFSKINLGPILIFLCVLDFAFTFLSYLKVLAEKTFELLLSLRNLKKPKKNAKASNKSMKKSMLGASPKKAKKSNSQGPKDYLDSFEKANQMLQAINQVPEEEQNLESQDEPLNFEANRDNEKSKGNDIIGSKAKNNEMDLNFESELLSQKSKNKEARSKSSDKGGMKLVGEEELLRKVTADLLKKKKTKSRRKKKRKRTAEGGNGNGSVSVKSGSKSRQNEETD